MDVSSLGTPRIAITSVPRVVPTGYGPDAADTVAAGLVAGVAEAGGTPVMLPVTDPSLASRQLDGIEGLVLSGGQDLDARAFGGERHPRSTWLDPERDRWELELFAAARERGLPVLAICRGLQLATAALGGTLIPHLDGHDAGDGHAERTHPVAVVPESRLAAATGGGTLEVNTLHHQAVATLPPQLRPSAYDPEGLLEGAEAVDGSWLLAVQWHPELMRERAGGQDLFDALVAAARA